MLLWLALLVLAGWMVSQRLELSGDLRKFMPAQTGSSRATRSDAARAAGAARRPARMLLSAPCTLCP
ncbi:MAG: hypothetical protein M3485_02375 [Pseudomonadota bacterium]|nr:hypothetical protein [Pseudomonadota bacterium]